MAARNTPPQGKKPDKLMRDSLMVALKREAVVQGKKTRKMAEIAEALVQKACKGDVQAFKEIRDTVDGRPPQMVQGDVENPLIFQGLAIRFVDSDNRDT